jgi:hypothetical protein
MDGYRFGIWMTGPFASPRLIENRELLDKPAVMMVMREAQSQFPEGLSY